MSADSRDPLNTFLDKLEKELHDRYKVCEATATPDSILLAVLNAIAEARK